MGSEPCAFAGLPASASLQAPPARGQSPASGNAGPPSPAKPPAPTRRVRSRLHPVRGTAPQVCVVCACRSGALLRHLLSRPLPVTPTPLHRKPAPDPSRCSRFQLSHEDQLLYTLAGAGPADSPPSLWPLLCPRSPGAATSAPAGASPLCVWCAPLSSAYPGAAGWCVRRHGPLWPGRVSGTKGVPAHVVRGKLLTCWGPPRLRPPQQEGVPSTQTGAAGGQVCARTTPAGSRPALR